MSDQRISLDEAKARDEIRRLFSKILDEEPFTQVEARRAVIALDTIMVIVGWADELKDKDWSEPILRLARTIRVAVATGLFAHDGP